MSGEITETRHVRWVKSMKADGVYAKTDGDGNCALYSLAVYFHALLTENEIDELNTQFALVDDDEKWLKEKDPGKVREKINGTALFDNTQVNRQKFVKIYKSHIDNNVSDAGMNPDSIPPMGIWKKDRNVDMYRGSSLLRKYVTLMFHLQNFLNYDQLTEMSMTPAEMRQPNNENTLTVKYEQLQDMFHKHLIFYATDEKYLSRIFIESVIEKVNKAIHVIHGTECALPFMFGTSRTDHTYEIDFVKNKVAISGDVIFRRSISEFVFINKNTNHWDLMFPETYRWIAEGSDDNVNYMTESSLSDTAVFTKQHTKGVSSDEGGEGGSAAERSSDAGGGPAKRPKHASRNTDAMTAAIMLRMNLV
jgi:hypothetical protein